MLVLAISCIVVALYVANAAEPCCIDRQFEADFGIIGSSYRRHHFTAIEGTSSMAYDFYNKISSIDMTTVSNGKSYHTKIVMDFNNQREYIVNDNKCNVYELVIPIRNPCIPDNATFLHSSVYGYGSNTVEANVWEYTEQYSGATNRLSVTKDACVPLVLAQYNPHAPISGKTETDIVTIYNNFHSGIRNRNTFNIPKLCDGLQVQKPIMSPIVVS